ncbi:hypothetical protein RI367_002332 [Sorochytrium milnesiophthora]
MDALFDLDDDDLGVYEPRSRRTTAPEDTEPRPIPRQTVKSPVPHLATLPFASPPRIRVKRDQVVELQHVPRRHEQDDQEQLFLPPVDDLDDGLLELASVVNDDDLPLMLETLGTPTNQPALDDAWADADSASSSSPPLSVDDNLLLEALDGFRYEPATVDDNDLTFLSADGYKAHIMQQTMSADAQKEAHRQTLPVAAAATPPPASPPPPAPTVPRKHYPLISPLSVMSMGRLKHLSHVHSARIELTGLDLSLPAFSPFRHLFVSPNMTMKKASLCGTLLYRLPATDTDVQASFTAPNPFSRRIISRAALQSTLVPTPLAHEHIFPCTFDAHQVDVFLNESLDIYVQVEAQVATDGNVRGRRAVDIDQHSRIPLFSGHVSLRLVELLRSPQLAVKSCRRPVWRVSSKGGDDATQQFLGEAEISLQLMPAYDPHPVEDDSDDEAAGHGLPTDILQEAQLDTTHLAMPVYLSLSLTSFASALPPQPTYLVSYVHGKSASSTADVNFRLDVQLSFSLHLPSSRGTHLPVDFRPVQWYSQSVTKSDGTFVSHVEIETQRVGDPQVASPNAPLQLHCKATVPIVLADLLSRCSDVPLIVEVWQHIITLSPAQATITLSGAADASNGAEVDVDKTLLGLAKLPLHHVLTTAGHAAAVAGWDKVLPVSLSELEYAVVNPVSGESQGWLSAEMDLSATPKPVELKSREPTPVHHFTMPVATQTDQEREGRDEVPRGRPRRRSTTASPTFGQDEPLHRSQLRSPSRPAAVPPPMTFLEACDDTVIDCSIDRVAVAPPPPLLLPASLPPSPLPPPAPSVCHGVDVRISVIEATNIPNVALEPPATFVSFAWDDDARLDEAGGGSVNEDMSILTTQLGSTQGQQHHTVYATPVVERTVDPEWHHAVVVRQCTLPRALARLRRGKRVMFKLWQRNFSAQDPTRDRLLGYAKVDLTPLMSGLPEIDGWYNITDFRGQRLGFIHVTIVPLQPLQGTDAASPSPPLRPRSADRPSAASGPTSTSDILLRLHSVLHDLEPLAQPTPPDTTSIAQLLSPAEDSPQELDAHPLPPSPRRSPSPAVEVLPHSPRQETADPHLSPLPSPSGRDRPWSPLSSSSSARSVRSDGPIDDELDLDDLDVDVDLAALMHRARGGREVATTTASAITALPPPPVPDSPNFVSVERLKERALTIEREIQRALERYDNLAARVSGSE